MAELNELPKVLEFTNRATGEMEEWPASTPNEIEQIHRYATELSKAADELRKAVRPWDEALVAQGDGKSYVFQSGNTLTHITSQIFKVPADEVLRHIDLEIVKPAVSITKSKLEEILAKLVRENAIDQEACEAIRKSYVPIRANDHFTVQKARKTKEAK